MAMRITTKMMQNTSLRNLNTNKSRQEQLTNQLATGKKISRPSDDPVVAIRALKLNSTVV
jgi:flagellar hook-associated protein 3 FlgL